MKKITTNSSAFIRVRPWLVATFFALLSTMSFGSGVDSTVLKYRLRFSQSDLRAVDVMASLKLEDGHLEMNSWGIPNELKKGWAEFVEIKSITDVNGNDVAFRWETDKKRWSLDVKTGSEINIHYLVKLKHDDYDWESAGGIDGRPTVFEDKTIFWVTKGLFIHPSGSARKRSEIDFEVPNDWTISTAWVQKSSRKFVAEDIDMLSSNLLMIGKHKERVVTYDNMSITIASAPDFEQRLPLIAETLSKVLPVFRSIFGELPKANYLVCVSNNKIEDGEAYNNSFHQMFDDRDLQYRKIVWANTLAHEMFHYWNGIYFLFSDDHEGNYWFSEGLTEYYANLTLIRAGIVSQSDYLAKMAFQFSRPYNYQKFSTGEQKSLVEAGRQKLVNWQFVYGGGASAAFILDVEIRKLTNGKRSLDDLMRVLYTKYGRTKRPITLENQIQEVNALTNSDLRPFFDQYITGTQPFIDPILRAASLSGLVVTQYQGEFYLKPRPNEQKSIFRSIVQDQSVRRKN